MKKNNKKMLSLILALIFAIPMQMLCVFAQDVNVEEKFSNQLKRILEETRDEADKVSVSIHLYAPDDAMIDALVVEEYGELLEPYEYYEIYGVNDYYENYLRPREKFRQDLLDEIKYQNNVSFFEEMGFLEEDLISDVGCGIGYDMIDIWLTVQELYDIAANDKVRGITYCDTTPPVLDIEYYEELMIGDVNKDGKVSPMDAYIVQRYLVGYGEFTPQQRFYLADVTNSDVPKGASNAVTTVDVLEILRYTVGYANESRIGQLEWIPIDDDSNYNPGDIVVDSD